MFHWDLEVDTSKHKMDKDIKAVMENHKMNVSYK